MQKLTNQELSERAVGAWDSAAQDPNFTQWMLLFANVIEGTVTYSTEVNMEGDYQVTFGIIKDPTYCITSQELCQIMDEGNHCLSNGSIVYEDNYAYITWSNKGHI